MKRRTRASPLFISGQEACPCCPTCPKQPQYFEVSTNKLEKLASEYNVRPSSHPSNEQTFRDIQKEISECIRLASNNLRLHKDYIEVKLAGLAPINLKWLI